MEDHFFDIPYYRELTSIDGWNPVDKRRTKYQICRAFFLLKTRPKAGPARMGRRIQVLGSPKGVEQEIVKSLELQSEVFQQLTSIEKSIVETNVAAKFVSHLATEFGDGKFLKTGGKVGHEISTFLKTTFSNEFHLTNSVKKTETVRYEFKNSVNADNKDTLCAVAAYQKCAADLYLLKVDFLDIVYKRSRFGIRKKISKVPQFQPGKEPRNVIKVGTYLATLDYWELMPESAWIIKDQNYAPEVEDDTEVSISIRNDLKDRPYWTPPRHPSLYQLSHVAFPTKWINRKDPEWTKEELMNIEEKDSRRSRFRILPRS